MLRFIGNQYLRLIEPFEERPYTLGRLVHQDVPHTKRVEIADAFWQLSECCVTPSDGLSVPLRKLLITPRDILQEEWCGLLIADVQGDARQHHPGGGSPLMLAIG